MRYSSKLIVKCYCLAPTYNLYNDGFFIFEPHTQTSSVFLMTSDLHDSSLLFITIQVNILGKIIGLYLYCTQMKSSTHQ